MTDFVRFFAGRELVSTGLLAFDDRPESYRACRSSFLNAIRGLDLSPSEEMDLLAKWLGSESSDHVKRIRAVNVNQPERGLRMVWNRLEECYGSPEVIESALFKRLDVFPKISNKDYPKLRELGDLLIEFLTAKAEGDLPGLTSLETCRGIAPIVLKIPYNLQKKWIYQGSKYKQQHNAPFPPFSFFVDFICNEARTRNDPSFDLNMSTVGSPKPEKLPPKHNNQRTSISVHKTYVSPSGSFHPSNTPANMNGIQRTNNEYVRQCPLHKKPHSLQKCRGFRMKPLEERKAILRENSICFRCCASSTHLAKDCKMDVQ